MTCRPEWVSIVLGAVLKPARQAGVSTETDVRLQPDGSPDAALHSVRRAFETQPHGDDALRAARVFILRLADRYSIQDSILFGSRARQTHGIDSDIDLAVVLKGEAGDRYDVVRDMAGIAFDVMLDTGFLVEALPLWADELKHPEFSSNPALIRNILREGVCL